MNKINALCYNKTPIVLGLNSLILQKVRDADIEKEQLELYQACGWCDAESYGVLTLTSEFTDSPDIEAVLKRDEQCFEEITPRDHDSKKKTLIISTFIFDTLPSEIRSPLIDLFEQAVRDEFNVYITTKDGLTKIEKHNLDDLNEAEIIPIHPTEIRPLASASNIESDHCVIYTGDKLLELARLLKDRNQFTLESESGLELNNNLEPYLVYQRISIPQAEANRYLSFNLNDYTSDELQQILLQKYRFSTDDAVQLVDQYVRAKNYAELHHLFPAPTQRAFFQYLDENYDNTRPTPTP